jgi:hypothetical protein
MGVMGVVQIRKNVWMGVWQKETKKRKRNIKDAKIKIY